MPYKCAFGCETYNSLCDACDSATSSDNEYAYEKEEKLKLKAAIYGQTLEEYLESPPEKDEYHD